MDLRFSALCLAVVGGMGGLGASSTAEAGNVGYQVRCGSSNPASQIAAAGHTPVPVANLDSESIAGLDGLVIASCFQTYAGSAAVDAAVANGLRVMIDTIGPPAPANLPGDPILAMDSTGWCEMNLSLAPNSPVTNGLGGVLTNDSLDVGQPGGGSGSCSSMGSVSIPSLPVGSYPFVTLASRADRAPAFAYRTGKGVVAISISQWVYALPGGNEGSDYIRPGVSAYYTNTIAWMMSVAVSEPPNVTCASEGYTGTKLTWCRNICEMGYTGATLNLWIQRWISKYRDLPYCAIEK